jgi:DNA helicase-2/ATP-dependent DNA helicase PcrA
MRSWQRAVSLPVDQLILTLAQDLFRSVDELALAHKLAMAVARMASSPEGEAWRLAEHAKALKQIASNERKFIGVSGAESGFDPEAYKGKVAVITVHKAKGLEWDRVYLVSANNYDFPSGAESDKYIGEPWFARDSLNLVEEALAQMESAMCPDVPYVEGEATKKARAQYVGERLRLLYVAITRARRELCVVWNKGRFGKSTEAVSVAELRTFWNAYRGSTGMAAEGSQ